MIGFAKTAPGEGFSRISCKFRLVAAYRKAPRGTLPRPCMHNVEMAEKKYLHKSEV
jgi:hypothetical protein